MNHAAWLVGHITSVQDYLIAEVPFGKILGNKDWDGAFDFSSQKLNRLHK